VAAYILADHRENNGAIPYLQAAVDHNNNGAGFKTPWKLGGGNLVYQIINNGTVGDYTILLPSKLDQNKNIIAAVFERKTWKDLAASIKDKRSIHQHKSLTEFKEKNGCYAYYIIEGAISYAEDTDVAHIPFKNLHAKVRSLSLKGTHSFQTKSQEHTAWLLANLGRDLARLYRQDLISFPLQDIAFAATAATTTTTLIESLQQAVNQYKAGPNHQILVDALANVMTLAQGFATPAPTPSTDEFDITSTSTSLLPVPLTSSSVSAEGGTLTSGGRDIVHIPQDLKTRVVRSYTDILMSMWCEIPKVSSKAAPILMSKVDIKDVICCPMESRSKMRDLMANLTFAGGTKIGIVKSDAIMQIAVIGVDQTATLVAQDIHAKILAQVPQVSLEVAGAILEKITLRKICETVRLKDRFRNEDLEDELAAIQRPKGTRKLGKAMAKKIIEIMSSEPDLSQLPTD
jgi:ERCC4-type nuclease